MMMRTTNPTSKYFMFFESFSIVYCNRTKKNYAHDDPACDVFPAGQAVHTVRKVPPDPLNSLFAGHGVHDDPPVVLRYVLAGQDVHTVEPGTSVYFPVEHGVQYVVRPVVLENLPGGHGVHSVPPVVIKYVPASHAVHTFEPGTFV